MGEKPKRTIRQARMDGLIDRVRESAEFLNQVTMSMSRETNIDLIAAYFQGIRMFEMAVVQLREFTMSPSQFFDDETRFEQPPPILVPRDQFDIEEIIRRFKPSRTKTKSAPASAGAVRPQAGKVIDL